MTANSADKYLESFAQGRSADGRAGSYDRAVQDQDQSEDLMDLLHLRKDLAYAGYSGAHAFKFDDNSNWTFSSHSHRSVRQLAQLDYMRRQIGSEELDREIMSRLGKNSGLSEFNLRALINEMHTEMQTNVELYRKQHDNDNINENVLVSANEFWEAYGLIN